MRSLITALSITVLMVGCDISVATKKQDTKKSIYFGYVDHSESREDVLRLAKEWNGIPRCSNWISTIDEKNADFRVLFGPIQTFTLIDHSGRILFSGSLGVLTMAHGNPDGTGVNICKMTED
jgi:hypothetical protein